MKKTAKPKRPEKVRPPAAGVREFSLPVTPDVDHLNRSIAAGGKCDPSSCWHNVAISALMQAIDPAGQHRIRVDAGQVRLNYKGYRYVADTPHHVKVSLLRFDREQYEALRARPYTLLFRRNTKIAHVTPERQGQINKARRARVAGGEKRSYPSMRKRVEGFSSIV